MCFSQDSGCAGFCRERQHPPDGFPAFEKRLPHAFVPRREKRCSAVGFPDHATATRQRLKSRGGFLRMCFSQDSGCAPAFVSRPWKRTKQGDKTAHQAGGLRRLKGSVGVLYFQEISLNCSWKRFKEISSDVSPCPAL